MQVPPPRNVALVAAGGALGAVARVAVGLYVPAAQAGWPWGTMVVNLSGALLLGLLLGVVDEFLAGGTWARPLLGTGILGGYTTFSTLSLEIERLVSAGHAVVAAGYGLSTLAAGLLTVWIGSTAAVTLRRFLRGRH